MKAALRLCLSALSCALLARSAAAGVDLGWAPCAPDAAHPVEAYTAADHTLTISITGIEADVTGIDVTFAVWNPCVPEGLPQAWRFDPGGCQAGAMRVAHPATSGGCPGLPAGPGTPAFQVVSAQLLGGYLAPPDNSVIYSPALLVRVAHAFPVVHLSAGQRYVATRITFPMGETVAGADPDGLKCGCASSPQLLLYLHGFATTTDGNIELHGNQPAYWVDWVGCAIGPKGPPATDALSDPACLTTAANSRTWGAIKAQYR